MLYMFLNRVIIILASVIEFVLLHRCCGHEGLSSCLRLMNDKLCVLQTVNITCVCVSVCALDGASALSRTRPGFLTKPSVTHGRGASSARVARVRSRATGRRRDSA